ncbi:MAG TPA: hypothetical protein ENK19_12515 [Acidobacteria bacterium]|nr:hypothetical protein [Acidobacteriota bacterium]
MNDGLESARQRRNLLERLGAKIPGIQGYLEREMRREVDKMERDWIAQRLDRARQSLQQKIAEWSRRGNLANLDLASSLEKLLDRFANRVRHADYGYTGYFDAVKIYEPELDRIYSFDLELIEKVEELTDGIEALPKTASEEALSALLEKARQADEAFDQRATIFEEVTQKGGQ